MDHPSFGPPLCCAPPPLPICLQHKKIPRHTEGVLTSDQFPINYFAVSEVAQKFESEFSTWFGRDMPDTYWRFNRIHSYGNERAPVMSSEEVAQLAAPKYN